MAPGYALKKFALEYVQLGVKAITKHLMERCLTSQETVNMSLPKAICQTLTVLQFMSKMFPVVPVL